MIVTQETLDEMYKKGSISEDVYNETVSHINNDEKVITNFEESFLTRLSDVKKQVEELIEQYGEDMIVSQEYDGDSELFSTFEMRESYIYQPGGRGSYVLIPKRVELC